MVEQGDAQDLGKSFPLAGGAVVVGRHPVCSICLHDPGVSRQHLTILFQEGAYLASHLGSTKTVINGVLLEGTRELNPGDRLQLSPRTVLRFEGGEP